LANDTQILTRHLQEGRWLERNDNMNSIT